MTTYNVEQQGRFQRPFVRLPCPHLVTGRSVFFAWKTSRRHEPGIQNIAAGLLDQEVLNLV